MVSCLLTREILDYIVCDVTVQPEKSRVVQRSVKLTHYFSTASMDHG